MSWNEAVELFLQKGADPYKEYNVGFFAKKPEYMNAFEHAEKINDPQVIETLSKHK